MSYQCHKTFLLTTFLNLVNYMVLKYSNIQYLKYFLYICTILYSELYESHVRYGPCTLVDKYFEITTYIFMGKALMMLYTAFYLKCFGSLFVFMFLGTAISKFVPLSWCLWKYSISKESGSKLYLAFLRLPCSETWLSWTWIWFWI